LSLKGGHVVLAAAAAALAAAAAAAFVGRGTAAASPTGRIAVGAGGGLFPLYAEVSSDVKRRLRYRT